MTTLQPPMRCAAYRTALDLGDAFNVVQITESLATTYIEAIGDQLEGEVWLEAFRLSLEKGGGEAENRSFEELRARLRNLQGPLGSQSKPVGPA